MADRQIAVSIKNIHKEFILPQSKNATFKQTVVNIVKKNNKVTQKTLDGISFDIYKGDFFGIVGRNGSGKSTLLKLIAGVYSPTAGAIKINGGLTPFIELGVGFNPELSGRDNVFLNGALLGFSRKQMMAMYDEIVDFAELGPFMDQKLKNYSSGMQVRLAFSIAIKAKNDVLIFDEVLAVGDEAFQRKCLDVFENYKASGQTVILVSHDMETVRQYCTRAALISEGKLIDIGDPRKVANKYSILNQMEIDAQSQKQLDGAGSLIKAGLYESTGKTKKASFHQDSEMKVRIQWSGNQKLESIGINIFKETGEHITGHNSRYSDIAGSIKAIRECELDYTLTMKPGRYHVLVEAFDARGIVIDSRVAGLQFTVTADAEKASQQWSGIMDLPHSWRVLK